LDELGDGVAVEFNPNSGNVFLVEELASNLLSQIALNPNHASMEKVEIEDVQGWLKLRRREAVGSPSNDIAF
jgi:hypothetical protein